MLATSMIIKLTQLPLYAPLSILVLMISGKKYFAMYLGLNILMSNPIAFIQSCVFLYEFASELLKPNGVENTILGLDNQVISNFHITNQTEINIIRQKAMQPPPTSDIIELYILDAFSISFVVFIIYRWIKRCRMIVNRLPARYRK